MFPRIPQTSPSRSFFLFGARGTGKTTYIKDRFDPDTSMYVDLLDPELEDAYRRSPQRLENQVRALPDTVEWVLIDEVQRAPRLLDIVLRLIESSEKRFVLTGSSRRKFGADPKTVISYFGILEDTLVGFLLPAYHRSVRKQQRVNPKFYLGLI